MELAGDLPAGFVRRDDGAAAHLREQRLIGRGRAARDTAQAVDEPPAREREAKSLAEQRGDFAQREAELLIEHGGQRERVRTDLGSGRTERVGRLQRMAALHTPAAGGAPANVDVKRAHDRAHDREVFLVLKRDVRFSQPPLARRACGRQRRVEVDIDPCRNRPARVPAIRRPRFPAGPLRGRGDDAARERGGLAEAGPFHGVQFLLQVFDLLAQPLAVAAKPIAFAFGAL